MSADLPEPIVIAGLEPGRDEILRRLEQVSAARPVVGITGPVGSGKSTLAGLLAGEIGGLVLTTDRYLPDYEGLAPELRDAPQHSDLSRLSADLVSLRDNGQGSVPVWSFHEHRRVAEESVAAKGLIVCEGIFALHDTVVPHLDIRVFVEASAATRWSRWEAIEQAGERGWGVDAAKQHFNAVAEPSFHAFATSYRQAADLVVLNDATHPLPPL